VNGEHFRAFVWLRWRIRRNQLRRGGIANAIVYVVLSVLAIAVALTLAIVFFLLGLHSLSNAPPGVILLVWDGLVLAFLFFWALGLVMELQRAEVLSLDRFLHMPVSLSGAFIINYLSSLINLTLIIFVPTLLGLSVGLACSQGPALLLILPLIAAFVFMTTALTYQFQGWLASLMANKRRRRSIIAVVMVVFILITQLPNLINVWHPWDRPNPESPAARFAQQRSQLDEELASKKISKTEYERRLKRLEEQKNIRTQELEQQELARAEQIGMVASAVLPPGWLALGAREIATGDYGPGLLCLAGMAVIGSASLWRAYRTTLRLYTGTYTARPVRAAAPQPEPVVAERSRFLEKDLPWATEHVSVVALATARSLLRAPEAKLMLLGPVIMAVVFGGMLFTRRSPVPEAVRPLIGFGAMAATLFTLTQLAGNQFGFERNGFRVFVLCPVNRRDILLGKNLALAPLALGLGAILVAVVEAIYPMRIEYLLALPAQMLSMFCLYCLLANLLSIMAPMRIAAGSLRPASSRLVPVLLHFLFVLVLVPTFALTLIPLGLDAWLHALGWLQSVPVCLILSWLECGAIVLLYRALLPAQGDLFQSRELRILNIVTTRDE